DRAAAKGLPAVGPKALPPGSDCVYRVRPGAQFVLGGRAFMTSRKRVPALALPALAVLASLVMTACGSSSSSSSGGSGNGKTGGAITIIGLSYPDYLDPALSYTVDGWEALLQVYPGLVIF